MCVTKNCHRTPTIYMCTTAVFWEEWADCVQQDKTYIFTNLRVKRDNYSDEIYVNTAKAGFKNYRNFAEDLAEIEPTITDMTTKETTISIIGVKKFHRIMPVVPVVETLSRVENCLNTIPATSDKE